MSADERAAIKPADNGPLMTTGISKIANPDGPIEGREKMALCRCGGSSNMPFCNGTHSKNGFTSAKQDGRLNDKRDNYVGAKITIHDNRSICAHAGVCTSKLPSVFRLKQEPFIDADGASQEEIVNAVNSCPSGALSYSIESVERVETGGEVSVFVVPNGPYVVSGECEITGAERAEGIAKTKTTLCRCGASKNKPFCDGAHWTVKFEDKHE